MRVPMLGIVMLNGMCIKEIILMGAISNMMTRIRCMCNGMNLSVCNWVRSSMMSSAV